MTPERALPATPAQTVGPYFGFALPAPGAAGLAPAGHPEAVTVHGYVYDGEGAPVTDALLEFWQTGPGGAPPRAPGALRRDGAARTAFTGFGRVPTDAEGHYALRTLPPGGAPYLAVALFTRGLTHHLRTRAYFALPGDDPLLAALPQERRATLLAAPDPALPRGHRFDVRLGGTAETVFLTYPPDPA
ncbi:protocatechuate 3,4-dioxygenase subunit alpha [Streptomyces gamaensis]|uniref:Protocatechuate 3,4-dioxygenase subunit alpha n=1 Tax=Streptomyces gamaensis TaxID=1763542 RepID=A0ABW0Z6D9_9ACTN